MASRVLGGDFVGGESSSWWRFRRWRVEFLVAISLVASRVLGGDFVGGESSSWWRFRCWRYDRKPRGQVCVQTPPPPPKKRMGQEASMHRLIEVWANKIHHFHEHVLLMTNKVETLFHWFCSQFCSFLSPHASSLYF